MASTRDNLLALHKTLVSISCVTGNEAPCSDALKAYLSEHGWTVETQATGPGRENVYAYLGSHRKTRVVLNSHLDVVPPYIDFSEDAENVYGRGSSDAKGPMAAQIIAAQELVQESVIKEGDVGLLYVTGEEVDHIGMIKANDLDIQPEAMIVGEPTENVLATGHKGAIKFTLTVEGLAAHSGYPHLGTSANTHLTRILNRLLDLSLPSSPILGSTTLNIGQIKGGVASNVIPAKAVADVMIRVATSVDEVWHLVQQAVESYANAQTGKGEVQVPKISLDKTNWFEPVHCHVVPSFTTKAMSYNTDIGAWKHPLPAGAYLYGPGSILVAHGENEFVSKQQLVESVEGYKRLITSVLAGKGKPAE
ncbi:hypothetical protein BZG36_01784 [Bifiguratus adelaidae]|uniref:Peptidase M20 dimerisation domain-containing protein n=1 Tax=Bifiguratus adelaidae TaxID=1938954 RepID=A0A261Y264_9FUNG|nr:hypothetical protein BZG36_01784 [Bifiguratus adelaidae]